MRHKYELCAVAVHADRSVEYETIAEQFVELDERGTGPHRNALLPWALDRLKAAKFECGMYCAEFSETDADGYPTRPIDECHFTWELEAPVTALNRNTTVEDLPRPVG